MSFDALTNRGEYLSAHYLAEVLPTTLKGGLLKRWTEEEKAGRLTPRKGLRGLRGDYFDAKTELADPELANDERLRKFHQEVLRALGFVDDKTGGQQQTVIVERAGQEHEITVAHAELATGHGILAIECHWAVDVDAAHDPDDAGRLLEPFKVSAQETIASGPKLASWLLAAEKLRRTADAEPTDGPRYVLILAGGVVTLADRAVWGEGRYLAVSLDTAFGRNEDKELEVIAALFGADSLRPPAEGGSEPLADLVAGSRQHAVGVSGELREGLRDSVELIANEVLDRIRQAGYRPEQVMELDELADELRRESLRYLYRILFLLYAEARPELGVLPVNDPEYLDGYSLARLGDLVARKLAPSAEGGFHLYESLDLLFTMVNQGHRPRGGQEVADKASEDVGLRFEPMRSDLFLPESIRLIGWSVPEPGADPDDPDAPKLDTRLRNATLYRVLRLLMLTKGSKKRRGGFISYAQLGINQLGAVYEGLMSYTGSIATEHLYEVAKNGDPKDGSWMIPASRADEYDDKVFVEKVNPITGVKSRVSYEPGTFVYRLAGRDRQTSASYYTPQSLTEVTVQLALKYRLDQDGTTTPARELLDWTICEPALGSGAFLNEAINQVAAEYLRRRQDELGIALEPEKYHVELQRVKAYIALHNCYGVDLNRTAVELAEVSLWLNVMHKGLQAPWFGLHLQRGNSLIGGGRRLYSPKQLADKSWLTTAPEDRPFRDGPITPGTIHHFLLPADGWGAVAGEKEARELAPEETDRLKKWRSAMKRTPKATGKNSQVKRLQALAGRVEFLWDLVRQRLTISEREIRRDIPVWGAEDLPPVKDAVPREKILEDLTTPGTPYWRLKTLMDTWCALWFWPLDKVGLLDGSAPEYAAGQPEVVHVKDVPVYEDPAVYEKVSLFGEVEPQQLALPTRTGKRTVTVAEQLRRQVPLADLDDWLDFAEALIGRQDIPADSLVGDFASLTELGEYEGVVPGLMGMEQPYRLSERFPWVHNGHNIADNQGFFHWELTFAQAFANGGFDLQVGNPPWVRPDWNEDSVLAESEPWFRLVEKPTPQQWNQKKKAILRSKELGHTFLAEKASNAGLVATLADTTIYPALSGTRPDLYRAFMCVAWGHLGMCGTAGLVHPDTHLGGMKEGLLRASSYRRLRVHATFVNVGNWAFDDATRKLEFGVHIYGTPRTPEFLHLSHLYGARTLIDSIDHHGDGVVPGQKLQGKWDTRAHSARVINVDMTVLSEWQRLRGESNKPADQAPLLYPVTKREQSAITALVEYSYRLHSSEIQISGGYNETTAKQSGIIQWHPGTPASAKDLVLQGPHFSIANPVAKQPRIPCRSNGDWDPINLADLKSTFLSRTNYTHCQGNDANRSAQETWNGRLITDYYRLAWRRMIPLGTERSLFASLIPPGPTHVNAVHCLVLDTAVKTALSAGFWASLPLDYLVRITGRADLQAGDAKAMPAPDPRNPLNPSLLLRTLRLNCLTNDFAPLWEEIFNPEWQTDQWAIEWPQLAPLSVVCPNWEWATPLRREMERRAALVEIDALVAVCLEIGIEELLAILRSRYPILVDRENQMWFDSKGRKIAADPYTFGYGQTKEHWAAFQLYINDPEHNPVPDGYTAPFYKADRENEYRQAHAVFSKRLQDAIDAGWQPS